MSEPLSGVSAPLETITATRVRPPPPADVRRAPSGRRAPGQGSTTPYLFLTPYFLVTAVFFLFPLAYAIKLSFYETNGPGARVWVGLSNFAFVLHDRDFYRALWNTTFFALCSIFIQLPLSLGLAMLLNTRNDRLKAFFRLAIFAPNLVGQAFVAIMFGILFAPQYGLFNRLLQALTGHGLQQQWLQDANLAMPAVVIASLWIYVGFNMIYFLAALQNVDQGLVDAAHIDGAGPLGIFFHVTMPAIAPVTTFVVVASTIGSYQLFELPYILFRAGGASTTGPANSALTVVGYLYDHGFVNDDLGMGAAVGWILTFIILMINLIQIFIGNKFGSEK